MSIFVDWVFVGPFAQGFEVRREARRQVGLAWMSQDVAISLALPVAQVITKCPGLSPPRRLTMNFSGRKLEFSGRRSPGRPYPEEKPSA